MAKKVLGLSFGRKMKNTEILVKKALMTCEEAGYEVEFIRVDDLNIKNCTGCVSCVVGLISGRGVGKCHLQDDFYIIDEALMQSDALIIGCPTYETSPTGRFKTICDRFGPSHDVSFATTARERGLAQGKTEEQIPDARLLKKRVAGLISVGGAMTQNWLAFNLPVMYELTMSMGIDVIDKFEYFGAMANEHVVAVEKEMSKAQAMGQHIVDALALLESEADEAKRTAWRGEEEGTCPVCHCDLLQITHKKNEVLCPVCGIYGQLEIQDGDIQVTFSEEEQNRSRLRYEGKLEHSTEISTCAVGPGQIPDLKERLTKYQGYASK